MSATKKKNHLRLVKGGNKPKKKSDLAINTPLMAMVPSHMIDAKRSLRASDYIDKAHGKLQEEINYKGRSRIYPEINVLNSAKGWYRSMIRLAKSEGFTDLKKFFKESKVVTDYDKRLFDTVKNLIEWEQKLPTIERASHGPE